MKSRKSGVKKINGSEPNKTKPEGKATNEKRVDVQILQELLEMKEKELDHEECIKTLLESKAAELVMKYVANVEEINSLKEEVQHKYNTYEKRMKKFKMSMRKT